jgi:hypothetical protein
MGAFGNSHGRVGWASFWSVFLVMVVGLLAVFADAAGAATPIDLGLADAGPGLAINAAGSAALTLTASEVLHYCRVDPGAGSCSAPSVFGSPIPAFNEDLGNAPLIDGNTVRIVETRRESGSQEDKFLYSGEPFGAATTAATTAGVPGGGLEFTEAVLAPAGTLNPSAVVATIEGGPETFGSTLAASGLGASSGAGSTFRVSRNVANTQDDSAGDAAISLQGSMLSAAYSDQTEGDLLLWRRYTGPGTPASIQSNSNWSAPVGVGSADGADPEVRMASGPKGLYLAHINPIDGALLLQRFNGLNGFEGPIEVTGPDVADFAISEDPGGLIHIAWTVSGDEFLHYRYARDASNGNFSNPQTLVPGAFRELRIATTAAGNGWVSWRDDGSGHGFVLPIAPGEPSAPPPPASTSPPSPSAPPKKGGKAPKIVVFGALGHGLVGSLTTPEACVPGGQVFKAKVAVKRKGSKAHNVKYTVKSVKFLLGKKLVSTDHKKPFEVAFATKGLGAGTALAVSAKLSVNLHVGHRHSTVTKTLKTTVRTCK